MKQYAIIVRIRSRLISAHLRIHYHFSTFSEYCERSTWQASYAAKSRKPKDVFAASITPTNINNFYGKKSFLSKESDTLRSCRVYNSPTM